jgi:hypothetical protein
VGALHEADTAFRDAPGEQALPAEVAGGFGIQRVELPGSFRLLREIEGFGRFHLHSEGKFHGADSGLEVGVMGVLF